MPEIGLKPHPAAGGLLTGTCRGAPGRVQAVATGRLPDGPAPAHIEVDYVPSDQLQPFACPAEAAQVQRRPWASTPALQCLLDIRPTFQTHRAMALLVPFAYIEVGALFRLLPSCMLLLNQHTYGPASLLPPRVFKQDPSRMIAQSCE